MSINMFSSLEPAFGYSPVLRAPEVNHEASNFMTDNMRTIKIDIRKMGVCEDKIEDLFTDVYISFRSAEDNGEGYDDTRDTDVRNFVYGRIKGYSKNLRYSSDVVECSSDSYCYAASYDEGSESNKLNSFQNSFRNAATADEIDLIDAEASVKDAIETCVDFLTGSTISATSLFRNVEELDRHSDYRRASKSKEGFSVFAAIREIAASHPEFFEAFTLAMQFRSANHDRFIQILDTVEAAG